MSGGWSGGCGVGPGDSSADAEAGVPPGRGTGLCARRGGTWTHAGEMNAATDILLVSDLTYGGAGIACARLNDALHADGRLACRWVAGEGDPRKPEALVADRQGLATVFVRRALAKARRAAGRRLGRFRRRVGRRCNEHDLLRCVRSFRPRLVHLHNLHEYVTFRFLHLLPRDIPIFWTLHDAWALTGYCFYAGDCVEFKRGCEGCCSERGAWGDAGHSPGKEWRRRDRFYKRNRDRLTFLTPSRWLAGEARARLGPGFGVEPFPNSVSTERFRPLRPRSAMRRALDLPEEKTVFLGGAQSVADRRKGFALLRDACGALETQGVDFEVVLFGARGDGDGLPANWRFVGPIDDERLLNLYYNAADAFVLPSLEDNLPNTLLESLAAGTPCVAFGVGGCPEAVRPGETGFLAPAGDTGALAAALRNLASLPEGEKSRLDARCRAVAEMEYAHRVQAERYLEIVQERTGMVLA